MCVCVLCLSLSVCVCICKKSHHNIICETFVSTIQSLYTIVHQKPSPVITIIIFSLPPAAHITIPISINEISLFVAIFFSLHICMHYTTVEPKNGEIQSQQSPIHILSVQICIFRPLMPVTLLRSLLYFSQFLLFNTGKSVYCNRILP